MTSIPISRWLIRQLSAVYTNSIGSSIVRMCLFMFWFTQFSIDAIVVLFPEPVTPASSTMPWSHLHSSSIPGGRYRPSNGGIDRSTFRATIPTKPSWVSRLTRNRHGSPSRSTTFAKSAPPSRWKMSRFRWSIIGKVSLTICSSVMGDISSSRSAPEMRNTGGRPTCRWMSEALCLIASRKILLISMSFSGSKVDFSQSRARTMIARPLFVYSLALQSETDAVRGVDQNAIVGLKRIGTPRSARYCLVSSIVYVP